MGLYELAYIADPELDEEALNALQEDVRRWVEASEGSVKAVDAWGKRKLAYTINKRSEGVYYIVDIDLPMGPGTELERQLKLSEQVMRYMITVKIPETQAE